MEQNNTLAGMLNLMMYPAFSVKDGTLANVNQSAQAYMLTEGTPVSPILITGKEEYTDFREGCLYLTVSLCGTPCGASVTRIGEYDIFVLEPEDDRPELQAMALAAQELRMPLTNVMTLADSLFPHLQTDDPTSRKQLACLNKGLFQLLRTVSNMSDAYHYSQLPVCSLETIDVCDYLEETFRNAADLVKHADITLNFRNLATPVYSLADSEKLERAVHNLLSNAIKFTPKGSTIDASLQRRGNMLYLTVQDSGSRIPEELRGNLFSRYRRQPGIEDSRNGIGLGMVLVRSVAAQHGGTVLLEYPKDSGTRITMTLAIRQNTDSMVRSPIMRVDYAGERDHRLLELSDVLPHILYETEKIN